MARFDSDSLFTWWEYNADVVVLIISIFKQLKLKEWRPLEKINSVLEEAMRGDFITLIMTLKKYHRVERLWYF